MNVRLPCCLKVLVAGSLVGVAGAYGQSAAPAAVEPVTVRAVAHFDFDRDAVKSGDRSTMLQEVGKMKDVTWESVSASGFTDSIGSMQYNQGLSARRAQSVKSYLIGQGLDPAMISTSAMGASDPVSDNETSAGRAENRRTEIVFRGVRVAKTADPSAHDTSPAARGGRSN